MKCRKNAESPNGRSRITGVHSCPNGKAPLLSKSIFRHYDALQGGLLKLYRRRYIYRPRFESRPGPFRPQNSAELYWDNRGRHSRCRGQPSINSWLMGSESIAGLGTATNLDSIISLFLITYDSPTWIPTTSSPTRPTSQVRRRRRHQRPRRPTTSQASPSPTSPSRTRSTNSQRPFLLPGSRIRRAMPAGRTPPLLQHNPI